MEKHRSIIIRKPVKALHHFCSANCPRRYHGGLQHLTARIDNRHRRRAKRAPGDLRGQRGGGAWLLAVYSIYVIFLPVLNMRS